MRPPFEISHEILRRVAGVERLLGRYEGLHSPRPLPRLRRSHRVRTIHDSLAIEGNTLTLEQATTVLEFDKGLAQIRPGRICPHARAFGGGALRDGVHPPIR